jgi:hypothetical protein
MSLIVDGTVYRSSGLEFFQKLTSGSESKSGFVNQLDRLDDPGTGECVDLTMLTRFL